MPNNNPRGENQYTKKQPKQNEQNQTRPGDEKAKRDAPNQQGASAHPRQGDRAGGR